MSRLLQTSCVLTCLAIVLASAAFADDTIKLGYYSQQDGPDRAAVGAEIEATGERHGRSGDTPRQRAEVAAVISVRDSAEPLPSYPTLPSTSPLLANPTPLGAGTFWYSDGSGHACVYRAASSPLCYVVTSSGGSPAAPAISPAAIAAAAADRLDLVPGQIEMSPSQAGLTGADSWFWLSPGVETRELTVALAGQTVTVTAEPSVEWRFGDGSSLTGGSGVPYRPGPPPDAAVRHAYETRCLPGDRGRNPYVLASCGDDGYRVDAQVRWRISYRASGRVAESGTLPTRTTETTVAYAVTEARAFLNRGGNP
jgi:hypothetical protein